MDQVSSLEQLSLHISKAKHPIILVPTMGGLHKGHVALIKHAKSLGGTVLVSIFLNPLQFGPQEDLSTYPQDREKDLAILAQEGVDITYTPTYTDIYPEATHTTIDVGPIGHILCGKSRPGHFNAVALVVTKLLLQSSANIAIFGAKDYQQSCVIKQVVRELNIPVDIIVLPTIREEDGLAYSTRNQYLSQQERAIAPSLYATLHQLKKSILAGNTIGSTVATCTKQLVNQGFKIDYIEVCDSTSLNTVNTLKPNLYILAAAYLGKTRLIDNLPLTE